MAGRKDNHIGNKLSKRESFVNKIKNKISRPYYESLGRERKLIKYNLYRDLMETTPEEKYKIVRESDEDFEIIDGPIGPLIKSQKICPAIEAVSQDGIVIIPSNNRDITYIGMVKMFDGDYYYVNMKIETTIDDELKNPERLSANGFFVDKKTRIKEFKENAETILSDPYCATNYVTQYFEKKKQECMLRAKPARHDQMGE